MRTLPLTAVLALCLPQALCPAPLQAPQWLSVDYSDLVDKGAIIRTGQTLGSALGSAGRGALQPFLDRHSKMLEYAVELTNNEGSPFTDVSAKYPAGARQPAWAALFRSGRMAAFTDNRKTVRLFLQGADPQKAYAQNYGAVRHLLNTLRPGWGALNVEVYAFENDYRALGLRLNPAPALLSGSYFGTPSGKVPLDLEGLADFFARGGQLEGARIKGGSGLQLYARAAAPPTLAGRKVALSDLAVAYRAVFHAGDNKAFISLDPHKDITLAAVNFGGYLEDTAVGQVVLEADKRFKTITSGLDPNTYADIRAATRQRVPEFLTVSERDMLAAAHTQDWVKTRFWFYPDSIEVQTDKTRHFAKIINPHFLADAERSRDDFATAAEFEKKKKALLLPAIRRNIDDLNSRFDAYAGAFAEYLELVTVGRLLAVCSWLSRVKPGWLDLDALLAVELPALSTERERTQLLAAAALRPGNYEQRPEAVKENMSVIFLSPELDKPLAEYFQTETALAEFLAARPGSGKDKAFYRQEAASLFKTGGRQTVRTLLTSQKELQAFALFAARKKQEAAGANPELALIEAENEALRQLRRDLDSRQSQLLAYRAGIAGSAAAGDSAALQRYHEMVTAMNSQVQLFQARAESFNKRAAAFDRSRAILVEIGGGINLEADSFKIRAVDNSPQLARFEAMTAKAGPAWTAFDEEGEWITNRVAARKEAAQKGTAFKVRTPASRAAGPAARAPAPARKNELLRRLLAGKAKAKTEITVKTGDKFSPVIRGELVAPGRIVFKRAAP